MNSFKNQKGQALIEYLILVILVAVVAVGAVKVVGQNVTSHFASVSKALNGENAKADLKQVNSKAYTSVKDFSNYMDNVNVSTDK